MNNDQMDALVDAALGFLLPKLLVTAEYQEGWPAKGSVRLPLMKSCPACGQSASPIIWVSRQDLDHEDVANFVRRECKGMLTQLASDLNASGGPIVTYAIDSPKDFANVTLRVRNGIALRGVALFDGERYGIRFDVVVKRK